MQFTIEVNNRKIKADKGRDHPFGPEQERYTDPYALQDEGVYPYRGMPHVCG
jgi:hypothetical protein